MLTLRPYQDDAADFLYSRDRALILATARDQLRYDEQTGHLYWMVAKPPVHIGMRAGCQNPKGYIHLELNGARLKAHQLIWAMWHGRWATAQIDHINGDRSDNRIVNLREATHDQNARNRRVASNNSTGTTGVTWRESHQKWAARITFDGRRIHLGYYDAFGDAVAARRKGEERYFGNFAPRRLTNV